MKGDRPAVHDYWRRSGWVQGDPYTSIKLGKLFLIIFLNLHYLWEIGL